MRRKSTVALVAVICGVLFCGAALADGSPSQPDPVPVPKPDPAPYQAPAKRAAPVSEPQPTVEPTTPRSSYTPAPASPRSPTARSTRTSSRAISSADARAAALRAARALAAKKKAEHAAAVRQAERAERRAAQARLRAHVRLHERARAQEQRGRMLVAGTVDRAAVSNPVISQASTTTGDMGGLTGAIILALLACAGVLLGLAGLGQSEAGARWSSTAVLADLRGPLTIAGLAVLASVALGVLTVILGA